jgi:hypothetical protein
VRVNEGSLMLDYLILVWATFQAALLVMFPLFVISAGVFYLVELVI